MVPYYLQGYLLVTSFLLSDCFPKTCTHLGNTIRPEVTISQGTLLGTTLTTRKGRSISAFLGIPYGQPPVGNLRFANPLAAGGWNGTRDASVAGSRCIQYENGVLLGEEDCLYLNVYTPSLSQKTKSSSLLPVMVYIHGGAFRLEYPRINGPDYILDADVVLVLLYSRLGPLGFLSTGDEVASGNWGLKDQVLGLEWVQDNIQNFGGDPDQVTIFGESTGAVSVDLLTLTNRTVGLFHRYITQSGSALMTYLRITASAYAIRAYELGETLGCSNDTSKSLISCLRAVEGSRFGIPEPSTSPISWNPIVEPDIEGAIITDTAVNLYVAGKIRDVPRIAGVVRDEGLLFTAALYTNETLLRDFVENIDTRLLSIGNLQFLPASKARILNAVKSYYFNNDLTSDSSVLLKSLTMLFGDSVFNYPTYNALRQKNAFTVSPQYFYRFDYRGERSWTNFDAGSMDNFGVTHADDLIYLFSMDERFASLNSTMSRRDYEMVDTMVELWTSFAINGRPTASALSCSTKWKPYSAELGNYLRIGGNSDVSLELQYSFLEDRMRFWDTIYGMEETNDDSGTETSCY